jgi:type II secretion system protein N
VHHLEQVLPNCKLVLGSVNPVFPPAISIEWIQLILTGNSVLNIDALRVEPRWLNLLSDQKTYQYNGSLLKGKIQGTAHLKSINSDSQTIRTTTKVQGLHLESIPALTDHLSFDLSGILSGQGEFTSNGFQASFNIHNISIENPVPLLNLDRFTFPLISGSFRYSDGRLLFEKHRLKGDQLQAVFEGNLNVRNPFDSNSFFISGNIEPGPYLMSSLKQIMPAFFTKNSSPDEPFSFTLKGHPQKLLLSLSRGNEKQVFPIN